MEKKRDMAWKVLNRKIVFQDTWVQLEASSCELPDGRIIEPFYIHRDPNFAVVVAVTKDQRLVLVRQYRHGAEKVLVELPAGAIEKRGGSSGSSRTGASGGDRIQGRKAGVSDEDSAERSQFYSICLLLSGNGYRVGGEAASG